MALSEHDDDHEEPPHRHPLPPDDRLWRHPSELDEVTEAEAAAQRTLWARLRRLAGS